MFGLRAQLRERGLDAERLGDRPLRRRPHRVLGRVPDRGRLGVGQRRARSAARCRRAGAGRCRRRRAAGWRCRTGRRRRACSSRRRWPRRSATPVQPLGEDLRDQPQQLGAAARELRDEVVELLADLRGVARVRARRPTAAQAASPHWPRRIAATKSRMSPTASRPVRICPVKYARLARTGSSSSGQPHHVESPHDRALRRPGRGRRRRRADRRRRRPGCRRCRCPGSAGRCRPRTRCSRTSPSPSLSAHARVEAVLDLLGVGDAVAVAVGLVRVRPVLGLEVVRARRPRRSRR